MKKAVGRGGATRKYDLLTLLGVFALSQDRNLQRQVLRLICLVTARYNWQNDQLSIGQEDIARLWSVDVRTVKREMAAFRARGWLVEKRAAARGRVALYGLGIDRILQDTLEARAMVGPDLVERMAAPDPAEDRKIIPFPQSPLPEGEGLWPRIARRLQTRDANLYRAWFAPLEPQEDAGGLLLRAPSAFHASYIKSHLLSALEAAVWAEAPGTRLQLQG